MLAAIVAAIAASVLVGSSVFAAETDGGEAATPTVTPGITGSPSTQVGVVTSVSDVVTSTDAAGDPCATRSFEIDLVEEPLDWPEDAWFKMTTHWCWNGLTVKSHTTNETAGVTAFGSVEGWAYNGIVPGSDGWYCYVAKGSSRNCSGNTEYAQGAFSDCQYGVCIAHWSPFIQEWENYHGGFFHN